MAPQLHQFAPNDPQFASSPPQQQQQLQQSITSQQQQQQQTLYQRQQQLLQQQQQPQNNQQDQQLRLQQLQQEQQRQQLASLNNNVIFNNNSNNNNIQPPLQQQQPYNTYPANKNWDILTGPNAIDNPMSMQLGPDGSLLAPRWDTYGLNNLPPVQIAPRAKNITVIPRTAIEYASQQHSSMGLPRQVYLQPQQQQQQNGLPLAPQEAAQQQQQQQQQRSQQGFVNNGQYLINSPPGSTLPPSDMVMFSSSQPNQHTSSSPVAASGYMQTSCSPEMPIKASPVEQQLSWTSWEEAISQQEDTYATPARTHTSFDEGSREEAESVGTKNLKVFTSSKKDDDGEFRKGQHTGRIGLNTSGKRSAQVMCMPTSVQEEDVLALKLTTFLEPEHRVVVPCGRCKDKTPEILRFHPGVNGKPMIDENGMVSLRNGHVKLIASAWCASTSHHRGPGTKFSFNVQLSSMSRYQVEPILVYEGRSDEVEIYASHGRDKGTRIANKNLEKASKSHSPPLHEHGQNAPPSPAKTTSSSPPSSPSTSTSQYESGPSKKRREETPLTPPMVDSDMPPTIKSLEPRKGPICRENHVIIIGSNFSPGMVPMFGQEFGTVIEVNPFYIECTTPIYPVTEIVSIWIQHNDNYLQTDKTYEFTDEQAQSDMEQLLRSIVQYEGQGGEAGSYLSLLERIASLPPSTDISGQIQSNGSTMLHNSVILRNPTGVEVLIEEGIELDIEDDSGLTALDYAIFTNNVEITKQLLEAGAMLSRDRLETLTLTPTSEMSSLLAVLCGVELTTQVAQEESSASHTEYNESSVGALLQEIILEDTEPESSDFDESASTPTPTPRQERTTNRRGPRPVSIATVSTQSTGMVSLAPTTSTMAVSVASSAQSRPGAPRGRRPINQSGLENIWQCAKKGELALVKHHLQKEPSLINAPWSFDGRSVLSSACASSRPLELVEFLVQRGAQVNSEDSFYKRTALHTLCEEGGLSQDDWTIVIPQADQDAIEQDVLATMRFLLDNGALVNAKNHWKETPLMRLLRGRDCPLMVQELYSRGADSKLKSSKDVYPHGTALCYAAFHGRVNSLKWMIENDLLLNDESNIKDALKWANKGESVSQGGAKQNATVVKKKEEHKAEAIRLLESWLGDNGATKRKALAREINTQSEEDWWRRMSGIVEDVQNKMEGEPSSATSTGNSKIPPSMLEHWKEVQSLSESLSQSSDIPSSPGNRMKWLTKMKF
ncbi:hypothetical protein BGZ80_008893 [Entomortierella chlamydospora]|uniref:IPT/TIG domain-containing protein n=1 Tax=Entomortierella chlamydospora TaxID=101097 RepID=A0A9P6T4R0_9FUNG|nr:hypothetical protein BGZ80_008893 [Entomortierella chlamydospora]